MPDSAAGPVHACWPAVVPCQCEFCGMDRAKKWAGFGPENAFLKNFVPSASRFDAVVLLCVVTRDFVRGPPAGRASMPMSR